MSENSRRKLPNVTLVNIDNVSGTLSDQAIRACLAQVEFGSISLFRHLEGSTYEEILWGQIPTDLMTSHALIIQYDGFIRDAALWKDEWLEYDYIGALWPWYSSRRVGNGGFSLRSAKLMKFLAKNKAEFPVRSPEDETLCRIYHPALEANGFRWAPEEVAREFSFERLPLFVKPPATFGFHGLFNIPHVLGRDALITFIDSAPDYVRAKLEWKEMWASARKILSA